jgi:hypothetical protein
MLHKHSSSRKRSDLSSKRKRRKVHMKMWFVNDGLYEVHTVSLWEEALNLVHVEYRTILRWHHDVCVWCSKYCRVVCDEVRHVSKQGYVCIFTKTSRRGENRCHVTRLRAIRPSPPRMISYKSGATTSVLWYSNYRYCPEIKDLRDTSFGKAGKVRLKIQKGTGSTQYKWLGL